MLTDIKKPEIIIFGGAFDPPHQGHIDIIKLLANNFHQSKILIIPANIPAKASGKFKTPTAPFNHRINLCKIAFKDISEKIIIDPIEKNLPSPNYSINTINKIKDNNKDKTIGFLIGQDQLLCFKDWHRPDEILNLCDLIIVKRNNMKTHNNISLDSSNLNSVLSTLNIKFSWAKNNHIAILENGSKVFLFNENDISDAKSSMIQKYLEKKQAVPYRWLPDSLLNYINKHGLYVNGD